MVLNWIPVITIKVSGSNVVLSIEQTSLSIVMNLEKIRFQFWLDSSREADPLCVRVCLRVCIYVHSLLRIWQVEPVPACDKKSFPLGQTHTSNTVCLFPEVEAFPSGRRRSLIFLASKLISPSFDSRRKSVLQVT